MKDLRPIVLCNVVYKIMAKVLANRLKRILPLLISNAQSAFVPGRSICDNILAAFEVIHYMKRKTKGKKGSVALKLDISKAYDHISWRYLEAVMRRMGFISHFIDMIMLCVTIVQYHVSVNGELVGPISLGRGVRQGDPLSPYLFIIFAEGLSALLKEAEARGDLHGCRVSRGAPCISHLLFADDSFLFFNASDQECCKVQSILELYERISRQAINLQKSGIFFSNNVSNSLRMNISSRLCVSAPLNTRRYLGLPSLIGRNKRLLGNFIIPYLPDL